MTQKDTFQIGDTLDTLGSHFVLLSGSRIGLLADTPATYLPVIELVPFELSFAPATFSRVMDLVLRGFR